MKPVRVPPDDSGLSELQGSLILMVVILIAVLVVKATIGDSMISAALDFGRFKVWGWHNGVSSSLSPPSVVITGPADGSRFYDYEYRNITGIVNVNDSLNRSASLVYVRINGDRWNSVDVSGNNWSTPQVRYPEGSYHAEAVAYDSAGDESPVASSTFETVFKPYPDAAYISDDVPYYVYRGGVYTFHINYTNTGYFAWNDSAGYSLSPNGSAMSPAPIGFGGKQVLPGENHTFYLSLTPSQRGDFVISFRMYCPDFGWFGDTFTKTIHVLDPYYDSVVVGMDMPSEMQEGDAEDVSITMMNTGSCAWYSDGDGLVYLEMIGGVSGNAYKFNGSSDRILMAPGSVVVNGDNCTFYFRIVAPAPGSYYTQYRMKWADHYAFGRIAGCTIGVKALPTPTPTSTPTPTPTPTPSVSVGGTPTPSPGSGGTATPEPTPLPDAYNAHGKMTLIQRSEIEYTGPIRYFYDGPLGSHVERSSRGASSDSYPYWDWDIGGPNGHYRIYNDVNGYQVYRNGGYYSDYPFDMNYGGAKGRVVFHE